MRTARLHVTWLFTLLFVIGTFLSAPLIVSAQTPTNLTSYSHCTRHNLDYASARPADQRCGEGPSSDKLAQPAEYGPFLCGVCQSCMDTGTCTLTDTMIVVGNVGNFILAIIGSLALLIFVIGGVLILVSQGDKNKVDRGRKFLLAAAVGVAITLGSILILRTLISTVTTGSPGGGSGGTLVCDGTNNGQSCGPAAECYEGTCTGLCEIQQIEASATNEFANYQCVDPATQPPIVTATCISNLCTGGTDNVCCNTGF